MSELTTTTTIAETTTILSAFEKYYFWNCLEESYDQILESSTPSIHDLLFLYESSSSSTAIPSRKKGFSSHHSTHHPPDHYPTPTRTTPFTVACVNQLLQLLLEQQQQQQQQPSLQVNIVEHVLQVLSIMAHRKASCRVLFMTPIGHLVINQLFQTLLNINELHLRKDKKMQRENKNHRNSLLFFYTYFLSICTRIVRQYQREYDSVMLLWNRFYGSQLLDVDQFVCSLLARASLFSLDACKYVHSLEKRDRIVIERRCATVLNLFSQMPLFPVFRTTSNRGRAMFHLYALYANVISSRILKQVLTYSNNSKNRWRRYGSMLERLCEEYIADSFGKEMINKIMYRFNYSFLRTRSFASQFATRLNSELDTLFLLNKLFDTLKFTPFEFEMMDARLLIQSIIKCILSTGNSGSSEYEARNLMVAIALVSKFLNVQQDTNFIWQNDQGNRFCILLSITMSWLVKGFQSEKQEACATSCADEALLLLLRIISQSNTSVVSLEAVTVISTHLINILPNISTRLIANNKLLIASLDLRAVSTTFQILHHLLGNRSEFYLRPDIVHACIKCIGQIFLVLHESWMSKEDQEMLDHAHEYALLILPLFVDYSTRLPPKQQQTINLGQILVERISDTIEEPTIQMLFTMMLENSDRVRRSARLAIDTCKKIGYASLRRQARQLGSVLVRLVDTPDEQDTGTGLINFLLKETSRCHLNKRITRLHSLHSSSLFRSTILDVLDYLNAF